MVRNYTDKELLDRVKSLHTYTGIPEDYWILGVQSKGDKYNLFDDKFYLFKGEEFIMVTTGTTNTGARGLLHFADYNKKGVAVMITDKWYHSLWKHGYHKGRMPALKQAKKIYYYRDNDKDKFTEQFGIKYYGNIGLNFHTVTYIKNSTVIKTYINGWSLGCQVCNNVPRYYKILDYLKDQNRITYCLIKEF